MKIIAPIVTVMLISVMKLLLAFSHTSFDAAGGQTLSSAKQLLSEAGWPQQTETGAESSSGVLDSRFGLIKKENGGGGTVVRTYRIKKQQFESSEPETPGQAKSNPFAR